MVYGLWQSAAGLQAQQYRQAVITNNLANASTPGFKSDRIAFQERLSAARGGGTQGPGHATLDALTGGLFATPVYTDFSPSSINPSPNPLDVAIDGDGFLAVRGPDGTRYTRDARLYRAEDGALIHAASGESVLDKAGNPIVLDSDAAVEIDQRGRLSQGGSVVAQLELVDFRDREQLVKVGKNLFSGDGARRINAEGRIRQFATEASGVEPTSALVEMIAAARAYEMNASMLSMQNESLGRAVNEVGRIG